MSKITREQIAQELYDVDLKYVITDVNQERKRVVDMVALLCAREYLQGKIDATEKCKEILNA